MPRSVMDQLLLSMEPDLALDIVTGQVSMLFIDGDLDGYSGRLFIHATRYMDSDRAAAGTRYLSDAIRISDGTARDCRNVGLLLEKPGLAAWHNTDSFIDVDGSTHLQATHLGNSGIAWRGSRTRRVLAR